MNSPRPPDRRRVARFVVVGAANTAASYLVYLLLLGSIDYRLAYSVAFAAGLVGGYWANARFVFAAAPRLRSMLGYLLSYAVAYLVSVAVLWLAVDRVGLPKPAAMLAALAVSVPLSYLLLRTSFAAGAASASRAR